MLVTQSQPASFKKSVRSCRVVVDVLHGGKMTQLGGPGACLEPFLLPQGHLVLEEDATIVFDLLRHQRYRRAAPSSDAAPRSGCSCAPGARLRSSNGVDQRDSWVPPRLQPQAAGSTATEWRTMIALLN